MHRNLQRRYRRNDILQQKHSQEHSCSFFECQSHIMTPGGMLCQTVSLANEQEVLVVLDREYRYATGPEVPPIRIDGRVRFYLSLVASERQLTLLQVVMACDSSY